MFNRIRNLLFSRLAISYNHYHKNLLLRSIRAKSNVQIPLSFSPGINFNFSYPESFKEICFGENVSSRNYCNFFLGEGASLKIHENVFFNNFCSVNCLYYIEIGANSIFGENVKIYDHNHTYTIKDSRIDVKRSNFRTAAVIIGKNCWIGSNVTILKGVTIGDNVIVGANCLIHKSVPSNTIIKNIQNLEVITYE